MQLRVLSWNLFHGRDFPPNRDLLSWRSRLLRMTERDETHAQVNVDLFDAFAERLSTAEWDVAMLQECPPRWWAGLAARTGAAHHGVLTARNPPLLSPLLSAAARINPDLIASWEGGSNLTLVRGQGITARRRVSLASRPERRAMALAQLSSGVVVATFHASQRRATAELELIDAARIATAFAGHSPLIFGGDLNLRPSTSPSAFALVAAERGLSGPTDPRAIDHILVAGAEAEATTRLDPAWREVADPTHRGDGTPKLIRLSDHPSVLRRISAPSD